MKINWDTQSVNLRMLNVPNVFIISLDVLLLRTLSIFYGKILEFRFASWIWSLIMECQCLPALTTLSVSAARYRSIIEWLQRSTAVSTKYFTTTMMVGTKWRAFIMIGNKIQLWKMSKTSWLLKCDEHVPEAEWINQIIEECIHATYHNFRYKTMPKLMLRYLGMVCVHQLNLFPSKGRVSHIWARMYC